jgi:hypothetical protein
VTRLLPASDLGELCQVGLAKEDLFAILDDDTGHTDPVLLADLCKCWVTVAVAQEIPQIAHTAGDVHIGELDIILGKKLSHRGAAGSKAAAEQGDLLHGR